MNHFERSVLRIRIERTTTVYSVHVETHSCSVVSSAAVLNKTIKYFLLRAQSAFKLQDASIRAGVYEKLCIVEYLISLAIKSRRRVPGKDGNILSGTGCCA